MVGGNFGNPFSHKCVTFWWISMSDPPGGTFLVTNWQLTNSLWCFFLPFPSLPTLCCFKNSIQSNDQSDQSWPLPVQLGCKSLKVHSMPKHWTQNSSPQQLKILFLYKCDLVCMWFAGALQWQTLFNFRDIREKLRGQDHSCTETNRQISEYLCSGSGKVGNNKVSFIICCIYMHIYCCLGFFFFPLN